MKKKKEQEEIESGAHVDWVLHYLYNIHLMNMIIACEEPDKKQRARYLPIQGIRERRLYC